jgi:hypothetical protein
VVAARENWVAAWLYLHHRVTAVDSPPATLWREARRVGVQVRAQLDDSAQPRHQALREQIDRFLDAWQPLESRAESGADHA